jgi:hypothetical protein
MDEIDRAKLWYHTNLDVFLNQWFADYDRRARPAERRRLLFLIRSIISFVSRKLWQPGMDPNDSDWEKIGRDCARPNDSEAFLRLVQKRERIVRQAMEISGRSNARRGQFRQRCDLILSWSF